MIEKQIQAVNTRKRKQYTEEQSIFQPVIEPGIITYIELQPRKNFISKERHSHMTPEDIRKRRGIILAQAALTLKATTRKLVISAIMPLERKCRVDQISVVNRLRCDMDTDTMDSRFKSIHGHQ